MQTNKLLSASELPVVILVGGQSQRLQISGQLKWQLPFADDRLLDFILKKIQRQSSLTIISASRKHKKRLQTYGLPVIYDMEIDFQGPRSGIQASLLWAWQHNHQWVATIPCDSPFFPEDLLKTLLLRQQQSQSQGVIATYNEKVHPVFGLWSTSLLTSLTKCQKTSAAPSLISWTQQNTDVVDFYPWNELETSKMNNKVERKDPFFNINTPEDYFEAIARLKAGHLDRIQSQQ